MPTRLFASATLLLATGVASAERLRRGGSAAAGRAAALFPTPLNRQGTGNTGPCSWMVSCGSCTRSEGCGWCGDCGRCVEGGSIGPSATNCVAWDYEQCSGDDVFADRLLEQHKRELEQRRQLVDDYRKERDNYVRAKEDVARLTELVGSVAAAAAGAESAESGDKSADFKVGEAEKRATDACKDATDAHAAQAEEEAALAAEVEKLGGVGKKLAGERADALEGGAEDTTKIDLTIQQTDELMSTKNDALLKMQAGLKVAEATKKTACVEQQEATAKRMQHEGSVKKAASASAQAASLLGATKASVSSRKNEAKRSRTRAMEISRKIQALTAELSALRNAQTAADKEKCIVQQDKQKQAKAAIQEWTECEDCQEEERRRANAEEGK
jgi:hypothetical protein